MTVIAPHHAVTVTDTAPQSPWTVQNAADIYGIHRWGQGYFSVNTSGNIVVHPNQDPTQHIDLKLLVDELGKRGIQPPLLVRFTDILKHRLGQLQGAFDHAIQEFGYQGDYICIYPIKANQERHVVEQVLEYGAPQRFGLEAGSKPELLALMAVVKDDQTPIVCNGFKDAAYIEAVILAAKIGKRILPVVENFHELELVARYAELHNVRPSIGLRVKLASRGTGRWEHSTGMNSKFGLTIGQSLDALALLRQRGMGDCLQLLHFHLGSQITNIQCVKKAIVEAVRVYVELQRSGAGLQILDVGGGLGVDYDGSRSSRDSSMNYTLQEYANDIVFYVKQVCDQVGVAHPTIMSESGRAVVAYHSLLVIDVLGASRADSDEMLKPLTLTKRQQLSKPLLNLYESYHELNHRNLVEYFHDAQIAWDEVLHLFNLGHCSLEHRVLGERLFVGLCRRAMQIAPHTSHTSEEFAGLEAMLADTYFCNFSIFQSMPDSWAIDQVFPIMPIHRLAERPTRRGTLADITCDSDGRIDRFIGSGATRQVLELHAIGKTGDPYYLAAFLLGAYQEILGDLHNLFGDTNAVHVSVDEHNRPSIDEVIEGDTVRDVLGYVQYAADELKRAMRKRVERALREQKLTLAESSVLLKFYESGLEGSTYLE